MFFFYKSIRGINRFSFYYVFQFIAVVQTFSYTGAMQSFTVPSDVTSISVTVCGAQGQSNAQAVLGGLGGQVTGTLAVTPSEVLYAFVGGQSLWNGGATIFLFHSFLKLRQIEIKQFV